MGKASKKVAKKQHQNKENGMEKETRADKALLRSQMDEEKYDEALGTLAKLIGNKCVDADVMYNGAYCYFMLGDYKRAADWINNTFNYAPDHIKARILLARICLLEDRMEDGLAIFDFVLANWQQSMSEADKQEMEEVLEYYGRSEKELLQNSYPHVAAFLGIAAEREGITAEATQAAAEPIVQEPVESAVSAEQDTELDTIKNSILQKSVPLLDKIRMFNSFAGAYFYDGKMADAEELLVSALLLDDFNSDTLRNMAYVQLGRGKKEAALEYASKMQMADFSLLKTIREA